jgi:Ni/Co efflux regulator RcnB
MRNLLLGISAVALMAGAAAPAMAQHNGYDWRQSTDQHQSNDDLRRANDQRSSNNHRGWGQDRGADYRWNRGDRMGYDDWSSARPVDYRAHHLRRPPQGYAWRETNGEFVLAAITTGVVASIMFDR